MWLLVMCLLASVVALLATTRIRDHVIDHEIFWMSALGALSAGAFAGAVAIAVGDTVRGRSVLTRTLTSWACVAAFVVVAGVGLAGMRHVLQRARTTDDHNVDVVAEQIQRLVSGAHARRPRMHIESTVWPIAAGALLQVYKANVRFAVDDHWTTMFGDAFRANGREDLELTIAGSPLQPVVIAAR